jgi:hypothetical protein
MTEAQDSRDVERAQLAPVDAVLDGDDQDLLPAAPGPGLLEAEWEG